MEFKGCRRMLRSPLLRNGWSRCMPQTYSSSILYPSMSVDRIYAVIAVCLELKDDGMSDPEIIDFVNQMFESRR